MSDVKSIYPARYYAAFDKNAAQPTPVIGWYDCWALSSLDLVPPVADLIPLTPDQWTAHYEGSWGVQNGGIVPYTPPVPQIPLKTQAATALQQARATIYNNYGILNEPTPDAWVTYLKALMAIEAGTDTTSTALPTAPTS